jgi:hypothetical protein
MKDDTVRRLQALEEEYVFAAAADGNRHDAFDDVFDGLSGGFAADYPALKTVHGDAA